MLAAETNNSKRSVTQHNKGLFLAQVTVPYSLQPFTLLPGPQSSPLGPLHPAGHLMKSGEDSTGCSGARSGSGCVTSAHISLPSLGQTDPSHC